MIKNYENKAIKINAEAGLQKNKKGSIVNIRVKKETIKKSAGKDKDEKEIFKETTLFTPVDKYWRDRFRDSKIDKCVEWATEKDTKQSKPAKK